MPFQKTGMLKTAKVEILDNLNSWDSIRKQAKVLPVNEAEKTNKEALDKEAEFQIVGTVDPSKFIYIHTTIMAGVKVEDNGFWITSETEKYINDNHDAWTCNDLLSDYKSFKRATTFVEHDQRLENAKGRCIDVIARDMGDTLLIDVLFSVDRRHKDLVANIENGIINAVSMGCTTAQTICTVCGNIASDPNSYCSHLKPGNKGRTFRCEDGKNRRAAELCRNNTFFDVSLVANPAFAGAVFRKILSSSEVSNHLLANILNSKIEAIAKDDCLMLKAASQEESIANISILNNGTIEIKTPNQNFVASEVLSENEVLNIKGSLFTIKPTEEKSSSLLDKVLGKLFGKKEATHPILNQTDKKDFSISDQDYSDIKIRNRHDIKQDAGIETKKPVIELNIIPQSTVPTLILEILQKTKNNESSRIDEFECMKCGYTSDLWEVKASSIDSGLSEIIECPRCFYASEESLFKVSTTRRYKVGNEVTVISGKEKGKSGEITALRGPFYIIKLKENTIWKRENEIELNTKKKSNVFVASRDIPVDFDEGTYWFDEQGNSVITKGEKVSFVTSVENGEYGLFITETGEDFFMPMCHINSK
jgi:hypothetical protein